MTEEHIDFFIQQNIKNPLAAPITLSAAKDSHRNLKNTSNKQLLNAVDIIELNSNSGTTTLLNTTASSSVINPKNNNINNNLQSSPPKQFDCSDVERVNRKRKFENERHEMDDDMIDDDQLNGSTSVVYSSNRKRNIQNNNQQSFLLNSDFFYSDNQTTNVLNQAGENIYNVENTEVFDDTMVLAEYQEDIFASLFFIEDDYTPAINPCYVDKQTNPNFIKPSMRAILIDWLLQVHKSFKLSNETLFLGISLMDRYIALNKVTLKKLQLLAITCLFTAAKVEEVKLPKLSKYCYMTDNAYTNEQMIEAEMSILKGLDFKVSLPGPMNFAVRLLQIVKAEITKEKLEGLAAESSFIDNTEKDFCLPFVNKETADAESKDKNEEISLKNDIDMIELFAQYLIEVALTSPMFIHQKHSYLASISVFIVRMMYSNKFISINTFILAEQKSKKYNYIFDIFHKKVDSLWPKSMILLSNGIEFDSGMQTDVELMIQEIVAPSTKLPTLDSKWEETIGPSVKSWCKEIYAELQAQKLSNKDIYDLCA
ncbi:hypothetical protein QEN19_000934 [Hanseniaspora menglaensis]